MSRQTYRSFSIRELDGGINIKNSPNEIDNKQCLKAENFNVDGNKLISAKGIEPYSNTGEGKVQALTLDGTDVWYIKNGELFKEDEGQSGSGGIFIEAKQLSPIWDTNPEVKYYIVIDGVEYEVIGGNKEDRLNNLILQLDNTIYNTLPFDGGIFVSRIDGDIITYNIEYSPTILYTPVAAYSNYGVISFSINGTPYGDVNFRSDGSSTLNNTDRLTLTYTIIGGSFGILNRYAGYSPSNIVTRIQYNSSFNYLGRELYPAGAASYVGLLINKTTDIFDNYSFGGGALSGSIVEHIRTVSVAFDGITINGINYPNIKSVANIYNNSSLLLEDGILVGDNGNLTNDERGIFLWKNDGGDINITLGATLNNSGATVRNAVNIDTVGVKGEWVEAAQSGGGSSQGGGGGIFIEANTLTEPFATLSSDVKGYITIDGVEYSVDGGLPSVMLSSLSNQLDELIYKKVNFQGGLFISRLDLVPITYSSDKYSIFNYKYMRGLNTGWLPGDTLFDDVILPAGIKINGDNFEAFDSRTGNSTYRNALENSWNNLRLRISERGLNVSAVKRMNMTNNTDFNFTTSSTFNGVGFIVNGVSDYIAPNFLLSRPSFLSANKVVSENADSISITIDGNTYSHTQSTTFLNLFDNIKSQLEGAGYNVNVYRCQEYSSGANPVQFIQWSYVYNIWRYGTKPNITAFSVMQNGINRGNYSNQSGAEVDPRLVVENPTIFNATPSGGEGGFNGLASITVGNLATLVVDEEEGGAAIYFEGLEIPIGEEDVGKPTVGTIYNGKTILGGYPDNDNIIFSKTSSLTEPLNLTQFEGFDAGVQSVSGGNKSKITGFSVGENGLYVFKENEVWYTRDERIDETTGVFNFLFRKITSNGAMSQRVITEVGQEIFYYDGINKKVRRLGYEVNQQTLRDVNVSKDIDKAIKALPSDQRLATSNFSYPNYRLYMSDGTGGTITYVSGETYQKNNICFVYNVDRKSWFIEKYKEGVLFSFKDKIILDNNIIFSEDRNENTPSGEFISKEYDMGDSIDYVRYGHIGIYGEKAEGKQLYLDIYQNNELYKTFEIDDVGVFRRRFDLFIDDRFIKFGLRYVGGGYLEINEVNIQYKPIKNFIDYQG